MKISVKEERQIEAWVEREQSRVEERPDGTMQWRHATPPDGSTTEGRLQRIYRQRIQPVVDHEVRRQVVAEWLRDKCTIS